ncbi:integrase, catalytic region, zinc finger, CCHC-type containing protein [Tanacetum coccineum]
MHNNIMAAGSKERPPMLGPGRYSQWRSRFLRYIDMKPNGVPVVQQHTSIENVLNMTPKNKEHFQSEKEASFLLLTGIGDKIYSTVDACKNSDMRFWIAIERLQTGRESIERTRCKDPNLFGEFGKFTYVISNATSSSTRPSASTRQKAKEIAKPVTPQSKLYKPTNNNLRTSSNSKNKTKDTTPRYNNDNQSGQFGNQRTMTVARTRETVGSPVVQTGIQCFNCKGFGHYAKECRKPKRVKDYTYHKEKMMMCKQAEQGVPLQAEQADWLADTDEEIDE